MNEETPPVEEPEDDEIVEDEEEVASEISSEPPFICACKIWARSACSGLPFYKKKDGMRYCVLHYPRREKSADFKEALQRKIEAKNFNFLGVWFPDELDFSDFEFTTKADFNGAIFSVKVNFSRSTFGTVATFIGATFTAKASFSGATFAAKGDFGGVVFNSEADFFGVTFNSEANFSGTTFFANANFSGAAFNAEGYFNTATFTEKANFFGVRFSTAITFSMSTFSAKADFREAIFKGNETVDFSKVTFDAEVHFSKATFSADAYFNEATFTAGVSFTETTFNTDANFNGARFKEVAYFRKVIFSAAVNFSGATFKADADFIGATFTAEAHFIETTFSTEAKFSLTTFSAEANFSGATFTIRANFGEATFGAEANFSLVTFKDYVWFAGSSKRKGFSEKSSLNLQHARIEKPDHVSFHTLTLRPHWFVNVDASKFKFTEVKWPPAAFDIKKEIDALNNKRVESPYGLFSIACRQLAINAEENHRYQESCDFRFMSMDAQRREPSRRFPLLRLHWWYWLASGYGEKIWKASLVLFIIWLVFAVLYTQVGFTKSSPSGATPTIVVVPDPPGFSDALQETLRQGTGQVDVVGKPLSCSDASIYSFGVMSLQKPDPKPLTTAARWLVTLETIFGPIQLALLALAIRRKFMR